MALLAGQLGNLPYRGYYFAANAIRQLRHELHGNGSLTSAHLTNGVYQRFT
jgi:hypothetical protein